jgi:anaerobic dimethyl sulfoxide reductase subunit B (iron-sulfur subunit)
MSGITQATHEYGLLIDYEFCSGCQSCEVSCKEEHGLPVGKWGIKVLEEGPWELEEGSGVFNYNYHPVPTDLCDLCADRTALGREPICVHHCLANVMLYGRVQDLAKELVKKGKQVLWVPQYKPIEARGEFVTSGKERHHVDDVKIEAVENWSTAAHRRSDDDHFEFDLVE